MVDFIRGIFLPFTFDIQLVRYKIDSYMNWFSFLFPWMEIPCVRTDRVKKKKKKKKKKDKEISQIDFQELKKKRKYQLMFFFFFFGF
ncbi:hypothetical protein ACN38_g2786 [Penicillium nordicum]|uniref:Uncharacterized protein n=1 Tax=Penicillium nordicum TaxID=229535 RepID=A0A0M9WIM1_9EURO|nr:hypothetical protein ACN38_g2786 [Penicillium nordicum]